LRVLADLRLPADSRCPGHRPAQLARCLAVGKALMSPPVSAMITSAVRRCTPGIVHNSSTAAAKGAICSSTRCEIASISDSRSSMRASMRSSKKAWWARKRPSSALRSSGSLRRSLPLASSASASASASPSIRARIIARPETPITSVATHASLTPASSNSLCRHRRPRPSPPPRRGARQGRSRRAGRLGHENRAAAAAPHPQPARRPAVSRQHRPRPSPPARPRRHRPDSGRARLSYRRAARDLPGGQRRLDAAPTTPLPAHPPRRGRRSSSRSSCPRAATPASPASRSTPTQPSTP
jgi:hypothetical protein